MNNRDREIERRVSEYVAQVVIQSSKNRKSTFNLNIEPWFLYLVAAILIAFGQIARLFA